MPIGLLKRFNTTSSQSSSESTLVCPGYPIELFPGYTNPEDFSVILSVLADDDAEVRTQRGELYMAMRGKRRKTLYDCYGFPIVNVRRKRNSLLGQYEVFDGEGSSELLLTISSQWSWGGSKMTVSMINWNKEHIQLTVKGNILDRHTKVFFDNVEVGRIDTRLPKKTNSICRESYTLSSAAYVDVVLMVVISLCLNDRYREG
ncbi:tubby C-terminal-like domain-containing protein [Thelephora terrestris]|uniref:Tubby C-terminal-like domain-containing protein n=1 Tax=Thelephora terrestris TaxID=56493 RepID=A0A9P6LC07_9AGAM|nr:tubby C-terminal-like domain-containing protein [Thelephora terrestris]